MGVRGGLSKEVASESGKRPCRELRKRALREGSTNTKDLKQERRGTSGDWQEGQCGYNRVNKAEVKERRS